MSQSKTSKYRKRDSEQASKVGSNDSRLEKSSGVKDGGVKSNKS